MKASDLDAVIKLLADAVTDYDGSAMKDDEEPRNILHCKDLRLVALALHAAKADISRIEWLEQQRDDEVSIQRGERVLEWCNWSVSGKTYDVRSAIDEMMKKSNG